MWFALSSDHKQRPERVHGHGGRVIQGVQLLDGRGVFQQQQQQTSGAHGSTQIHSDPLKGLIMCLQAPPLLVSLACSKHHAFALNPFYFPLIANANMSLRVVIHLSSYTGF